MSLYPHTTYFTRISYVFLWLKTKLTPLIDNIVHDWNWLISICDYQIWSKFPRKVLFQQQEFLPLNPYRFCLIPKWLDHYINKTYLAMQFIHHTFKAKNASRAARHTALHKWPGRRQILCVIAALPAGCKREFWVHVKRGDTVVPHCWQSIQFTVSNSRKIPHPVVSLSLSGTVNCAVSAWTNFRSIIIISLLQQALQRATQLQCRVIEAVFMNIHELQTVCGIFSSLKSRLQTNTCTSVCRVQMPSGGLENHVEKLETFAKLMYY